MNRPEAKRLVLSVMASTLWNDLNGVGAGYLNPDDDGDRRRLYAAAEELISEFRRRSAGADRGGEE